MSVFGAKAVLVTGRGLFHRNGIVSSAVLLFSRSCRSQVCSAAPACFACASEFVFGCRVMGPAELRWQGFVQAWIRS